MIANPIINSSIMSGSLAIAQSSGAMYDPCTFQVTSKYSNHVDVTIEDNGNTNIFIVMAASGDFFLAIPKLEMNKEYTVDTYKGRTISFMLNDEAIANSGYIGIRVWFKLISGTEYATGMYVIATLY